MTLMSPNVIKHLFHGFIALQFIGLAWSQTSSDDQDFEPSVTARCERGVMNIVVATKQPFNGVIHTRDNRTEPCLVLGSGGLNTTLSISLTAKQSESNYCGVYRLRGSEERTVALTVRVHKTLELSDDKYFIITCSQSGFRNARNELSRVSLKLMDPTTGSKVFRLIHGNQYTLRAEYSSPNEQDDDQYNLRVRNCFSFISNVSEVELIDKNGCPKVNLISNFVNNGSDWAEATIYSMFKFPDSHKIHFQCDIILCRANCPQFDCHSDIKKLDGTPEDTKDAIQLVASTTAHVIEPGEESSNQIQLECTEWRFPWLIALCIMLAIMLLVMLLVNIFLCSSLSCNCVRNDELEREDSIIEEYDPYKIDWMPSHYGSRSSLNKAGYKSGGGSSLNSYSGNDSEPYAPVSHSRPNSRYSNKPSQMSNPSQTYVKY